MVLNTVGSIATHIATKYVLPTGVSGVLVETVSLNRIKVQNFVGTTIDPSGIDEQYQDIITDFAKADAIEEAFAWSTTVATSGGAVIVSSGASASGNKKLGDFEIQTEGKSQTAALNYLSSLSKDIPTKLRETAEKSLNELGRGVSFYKANG
jgi:hypothetical protein